MDLSTVEAFVAFAKHVDPETFSLLPLADSVMLGLGPQIIKSVTASDLASPDAWTLEWDMFRAHVGPISGLELLELLDGYQVQVGPHAHCAAPPQPPPVGLESHRRISVQPSDDSIDSCLNWFTVDLFVGTTGLVEAITLDVWEP